MAAHSFTKLSTLPTNARHVWKSHTVETIPGQFIVLLDISVTSLGICLMKFWVELGARQLRAKEFLLTRTEGCFGGFLPP